jgi:hypothetical protein
MNDRESDHVPCTPDALALPTNPQGGGIGAHVVEIKI